MCLLWVELAGVHGRCSAHAVLIGCCHQQVTAGGGPVVLSRLQPIERNALNILTNVGVASRKNHSGDHPQAQNSQAVVANL